MKRIIAIVRPQKLEPLKEALLAADVGGLTVGQVTGCGKGHGWKEYYRGSEMFLNMVKNVKFELIVEDSKVEGLIDLICDVASTGEVGDGKVFVSPVEEVVRIRTRERGEKAV